MPIENQQAWITWVVRKSTATLPRRLALALLTPLVALGIELMRERVETMPVPFLLIFGSVAVVSAAAGSAAANLSASFAALFVVYATLIGFGPENLTGGPFEATIAISIAFLIANVLGKLRDGRENLIRELAAARRELEGQQAGLEERMRAQTETLRKVTRMLLDAQETERAAIARELHDELSQTLTGIKLTLSAVLPEADEVRGHWRKALDLIDGLMSDVRSLSLSLRPPLLDRYGLAAGIQAHVEQQARLAGLSVSFDLDSVPTGLPDSIAMLCFRCVQESLTNIIKHARATHVDVRLRYNGDSIGLRIEDDGRGFEPPTVWVPDERGGLGIPGLMERFDLAEGRFEVSSAPGDGTRVEAWIRIDPTIQAD
jgi:signal transduction histidine kinase